MKEVEGLVIFLKNDMEMLEPYLYVSRFSPLYHLSYDKENLEMYDAKHVVVSGVLNRKSMKISANSLKEAKQVAGVKTIAKRQKRK